VSYPASKNKRKHPRFELLAFVEVQKEQGTVVLPARNLSLGGVSVDADGHDLRRFPDGMILDLAIFDAQDQTAPPVRSPARVLRHDPDGSMALMWNATDPRVIEQLASLLGRLHPRKK
jgi:PilZ domain